HDSQLAFSKLANSRNIGRINDFCARLLHLADQCFHKRIDGIAKSEILAHDSKARAFQSSGIEELRVIGKLFALAARGRGIFFIDRSHGAEKNRDIAYCSRHRTGSILAVRDRNNPAAADESNRRLKPCKAISGRWTPHRPVRLGANARNREIGGNTRSGSRTRAARIAIKSIRIASKSAASAPSARRMAG